MVKYELLLISRNFQRPRQFELDMTGRLSGAELATLLLSVFPGQHWFIGAQRLETFGVCQSGQSLILSDLPQGNSKSLASGPSTKLFISDGRDAGAWITLAQGEQVLGRGAPLWLQDPLLSRCHAVLTVSRRRWRVVPCEGHKVFGADGRSYDSLDLGIGSTFRLGNTTFIVADPVGADSNKPNSTADLEVKVAAKPDVSRLITVILAAFVPLLTGVLLAFLMHSMLFLIISGVSALMAIVPAWQMVSERRKWQRTMRAQRTLVIQARDQYAAPLGQSLLAGLDRTALGIAPTQLPPMVWGDGLWYPHVAEESGATTHRRSRLRRARTKSDAPCPGPVFCAAEPGVWQIVASQDSEAAEVLANIFSRFIPLISVGALKLVIDPSICCLPASLLLLNNVRHSELNVPDDSPTFGRETPELRTIYLTSRAPFELPNTLVISLCPALSEQAKYWISLDPIAATLPDSRFILQRLHRLSTSRLDRIVHQFVDLQTAQNVPSTDQALSSTQGFRACVGLNADEQEVHLDLDADGPHMLICGTTGSGKSEALRRIISDLAYQYSPEQLGLVLVDFKGGAGLGLYEHLPQVQLFASDLDEAAAQRTIEQLEHEVQRRERILADRGCSDLFEYQCLDTKPQSLPRLLVVIDEFRVFVETLPLAGPKIDRLAAVGRALGIHLLLSTQRPAGALTGQTRANLNTIIALHVNDPSESVELVGTTAATTLDRPGLAIIKSSSRPTETFQFHLAVEPPLEGELFERDRHTMRLMPLYKFSKSAELTESDPLRAHASGLISRWSNSPKPSSGFALALPMPNDPWTIPSNWQEKLEGSLYCGVRDNLHGGRLDSLIVGSGQKRSLLISGLPDSGAKHVFSSLARMRRRILCFGPSPLAQNDENSGLKVVTGQDPYLFFDALDFLETTPKDSDLIILIHGITQLQAELHPQHFQRLDEALGTLLRHSDESTPLVICAADRDQNSLKSTGLFTTQWYFPLNASDSLKMMWPKLPACSDLTGRGVEITSGHPPQIFQLTALSAREVDDHQWDARGTWFENPEQSGHTRQMLLGYLPFGGATLSLPDSPRLVVIYHDEAGRMAMSKTLSQRWGALYMDSLEEIIAFSSMCHSDVETAPTRICVNLASTSDSRLAPALENIRLQGIKTILFVPPSSRLTYDLGNSSLNIDDRELVVVESEHARDMLPSTWPPLHRGDDVQTRGYWRAIISRNGQPRLLHIPRTSVTR